MREDASQPAASGAAPDPEVLIQRYLEDRLSEAEAAQLLELLQSRPDLGERILGQLQLDAMLRQTREALPKAEVSSREHSFRVIGGREIPPAAPPARFSYVALTSAAALAACVTLLATWLWQALEGKGGPTEEEPTTTAVAVLSRAVNLQWEGQAHLPGTPLVPGVLRLKSGLVQIEFYQGARITLEGPAELRLISSNEAACSRGKLSAHVPPQARGFRVHTPRGTLVDLGTDFGLDLTAAEPAVHVFKGEVEFHPDDSPMRQVLAGEARALGDPSQALAARPEDFSSLGELEARTAESQRLAFESWIGRASRWNEDPSLLLRLDFQDNTLTRSLRNHAAHAPAVPEGSIVGCEWTEGRWQGKRALQFRNISDRVRLSVPGDYASITLCAWVRVNGLDRAFNSLFMSEGFRDGAVHWQITRGGALRLGIASRSGHPSQDYDTPLLFTAERFGQWLHLATVFDAAAGQVRHYVGGALVATEKVRNLFPLHPGMAELGNWNDRPRGDRVAIRHFSGAMDEFLLFQRPLEAQEIAELAR